MRSGWTVLARGTRLGLAALVSGSVISACSPAPAAAPAAAPTAPPPAAPTTATSPTQAPAASPAAKPTQAASPAASPAAQPSAAPTTAPAAASPNAAKVSMWGRSDLVAFLPGVVDQFNATHPNIQIELTLVPADQVTQKFAAAASGGAGPDLVSVDLARVPQYAKAGWFPDITDKAKALQYFNTLSPSHVNLATVDGKIYALPFTADVSVLTWNKTLFQQAGLDPEKGPTTWAEIQSDAEKIRALGSDTYGCYFSGACGGCMAFTFLPFVWASGGDVLQGTGDSAKPVIYPNDKLKSALDFYHTLWTKGVVHPQAQTDTGSDQFGPFFSGKVGMYVQGTFPLAAMKKDHPELNWGVIPVPSSDGSGHAAFTGGDSIAITKQAATSDAAWTAFTWMTNEGQTALAKAGVLPTRSDIAASAYAAQDPRLAVFADALKVGHTPNIDKVAALFYDSNGPWGRVVFDGVFKGTIDEAMQQGQKDFQSLIG